MVIFWIYKKICYVRIGLKNWNLAVVCIFKAFRKKLKIRFRVTSNFGKCCHRIFISTFYGRVMCCGGQSYDSIGPWLVAYMTFHHASASVMPVPANLAKCASATASWRATWRGSCWRVPNNAFYKPIVMALSPRPSTLKATSTTTRMFINIYSFVLSPNNATNITRKNSFIIINRR